MANKTWQVAGDEGVRMTNLLEMQELLRRFAEQREWEKFHRVRNLVLALVGEVGELAALVTAGTE